MVCIIFFLYTVRGQKYVRPSLQNLQQGSRLLSPSYCIYLFFKYALRAFGPCGSMARPRNPGRVQGDGSVNCLGPRYMYDSPTWPCGHHTQDGHHITFRCPIHATERRNLIGARDDDTWEALDRPLDIKDEGSDWEEYFDRVEAFFSYLFTYLT